MNCTVDLTRNEITALLQAIGEVREVAKQFENAPLRQALWRAEKKLVKAEMYS